MSDMLSGQLSPEVWIALVVGNTRLHWGLFASQRLIEVCHTPHLVTSNDLQTFLHSGFSCREKPLSLWVASVVPDQTALCLRASILCHVVERSRIPLKNFYPTLGIDRAINLLSTCDRYEWPVLVIDAGTALTFTAGIQSKGAAVVYGGAILPGMRLQAESLGRGTASLEQATKRLQYLTSHDETKGQRELPERWAMDTDSAIASGLIYGAIAVLTDTLADWWQRYPSGSAVLTGGDSSQLHRFLQLKTPEIASRVSLDSNLMFYGMSAYRQYLSTESG